MSDDLRNRVERAIQAVEIPESGWPEDRAGVWLMALDEAVKAADAALAEIGAARVKPLEWEWYHPPSVWRARSIVGEYEVDTHGSWTLMRDGVIGGVRDGGKEGAEADNKRRILAAIEPAPVSVREAARVLTEDEAKARLLSGGQIVYSTDGDVAWFADDSADCPEEVVLSLRRKGFLKRVNDEECPRGFCWDEASDKLRAIAEGKE